MSNRLKTNLIKYGITVTVAIIMIVAYIISKDFSNLSLIDKYKVLADAFTLPGLFMTSFGLLVFIANQGALDGLRYCLMYAAKALILFGRIKKPKNYTEFRKERREHNIQGYSFLFVVGVISLVISLIFIFLYHN